MTAERTPVAFIHGLWLHATSWNPWLQLFRDAGYENGLGWPGEPATVKEAREQPDLVANMSIDDATAQFTEIIGSLEAKPVIIGHSFGGLFAEKLLGQDLGIAGVAIDPAQIKGVLPLPVAQLRAALPALGNPANLHRRSPSPPNSSGSGSATSYPRRSQRPCLTSGRSPVRLECVPSRGRELRVAALRSKGQHRQRPARARCC